MKKNKIIFWTATIIIAIWEAIMPIGIWIFALEYMTFGTRALGYPDYFVYSLVLAKALGVIAIVYPKTPAKLKEWAYAGLTFSLIFAFISHASIDRNFGYMIMPVVFLAILFTSYFYKNKMDVHS